MSEEIKLKIQEELRQLEQELRTEIPQDLKIAVAMGDLSMIDVSRLPHDRVGYGSTVLLYDLDNSEELTYKLVMAEDANVAESKISTSSPVGRGLMGRSEGDEVEITTPAGKRRFEIIKLTTIHESPDA